MKLFIKILIVGVFLFVPSFTVSKTELSSIMATAVAAPSLTCKPFDTWYLSDGGARFDYQVVNGNWNLPSDVEQISTITVQTTGIWEYMSDADQAKYFIVFLSFEPSGDPLGQHDICVYRVPYLQ